ncbi:MULTISPECIES: restriction endonuclease-related protein [unclassified Microcoleus]|uniref:restriction endonuclease-related protein n=1 Tax=unclassified Microcoleus TaxID=2642155 RepID=UPI002FD1CDC1
MVTSKKTEVFDYLVIGSKEYLDQDKKYPCPDLLRHAMNALALEMKKSIPFPKTMNGFLKLLEHPVKDWCPSHFIPEKFDRDFGLMDEGSLSEEANDYVAEVLLGKGGIPEYASASVKQLALDNSKFTTTLDKLRDVYNDIDSEIAQQEYLPLRRFLIENPYTTPSQIRKIFMRTKHISTEEVGELYEECQENQTYWYCDRCGVLTEKHGKLKGIKPRLCGNHHKDQSYVHQVEWETGLLRIKDGIHQRVCFPGIPELNLYSALAELTEKHPDCLQQVKLYPGLDRYDLQLRFSDGTVWAIDIKDVRDPYKLAKNIKPLYSEGSLRYDESFYVISDRCIANYPDYLEILRQAAKQLPNATHLVSEKSFKIRVNDKIAELQKGGTI